MQVIVTNLQASFRKSGEDVSCLGTLTVFVRVYRYNCVTINEIVRLALTLMLKNTGKAHKLSDQILK